MFISKANANPPSSKWTVLHAFEDLRHEVLFQRFPVIVDGRALQHIKRLRLLDLALDDDPLRNSIDLLAASAAGDLHARRLLLLGLRALVLRHCQRGPRNQRHQYRQSLHGLAPSGAATGAGLGCLRSASFRARSMRLRSRSRAFCASSM